MSEQNTAEPTGFSENIRKNRFFNFGGSLSAG